MIVHNDRNIWWEWGQLEGAAAAIPTVVHSDADCRKSSVLMPCGNPYELERKKTRIGFDLTPRLRG